MVSTRDRSLTYVCLQIGHSLQQFHSDYYPSQIATASASIFLDSIQPQLLSHHDAFHDDVLVPILEWRQLFKTRIETDFTALRRSHKTLQHYQTKVKSLQTYESKRKAKNKALTNAESERLTRNIEKLHQAGKQNERCRQHIQDLLVQVVDQGWKEWIPILQNMMQVEQEGLYNLETNDKIREQIQLARAELQKAMLGKSDSSSQPLWSKGMEDSTQLPAATTGLELEASAPVEETDDTPAWAEGESIKAPAAAAMKEEAPMWATTKGDISIVHAPHDELENETATAALVEKEEADVVKPETKQSHPDELLIDDSSGSWVEEEVLSEDGGELKQHHTNKQQEQQQDVDTKQSSGS